MPGAAYHGAMIPPLAVASSLAALAASFVPQSPAPTQASVQRLLLPAQGTESFAVRVRLDGRPRTLRLGRHRVRADDFELVVVDRSGRARVTPPPPPTTVRGVVVEEPRTVAAGCLDGDGLHLAVLAPDGKAWFVEPLERGTSGAVRPHRVHRALGAIGPGRCAAVAAPGVPGASTFAGPLGGPGFRVAEIAFDADYEYFQRNGSSVSRTVSQLEAALAAANEIYERDVEIGHLLTRIVVRTAEPDPYTSLDPRKLLVEFRNHWNAAQRGVRRDLAHFFTGKRTTGNIIGLAYVGVVCNQAWAYGLSVYRSSFDSRVSVLAHELGHNWSAPHCLDPSCVIMCGGCHKFGPKTAAKVIAFKLSRNCLTTPAAPRLTRLTPGAVTSYAPATVKLEGSGLRWVQRIEVGGVRAPVVSRVDDKTVRFVPPSPMRIGAHPVRAFNPVGSGGGVSLQVRGNHPAVLDVPTAIPRGAPRSYAVHTDRAWRALLLVSSRKQPSVLPGFVTLGIGAGFAELWQVAALDADGRGVAATTFSIPSHVPQSLVHWQAVAFDSARITLPLEATAVVSSVIY